jgi:protein-disulfide isomerase
MPETLTKRDRRDAARQARRDREAAATAAASRRRRLLQLGGLLAAAAVIVVIAIDASSGGGGTEPAADGPVAGAAEAREMLAGIPQDGVTLGRPDAPVTLVEFADPQCPFCRAFALDDLPHVIEDYVRTGKAKIELRLLTFLGEDSVEGGRALAAAAQQDKLWNASEIFYANQGEENSGYVDDAFLRRTLGAVPGFDVDRALKDATSTATTEQLAEASTLARRHGIDGTPTVLVGPTGGTLKPAGDGVPTAGAIGKAIEVALAKKAGT